MSLNFFSLGLVNPGFKEIWDSNEEEDWRNDPLQNLQCAIACFGEEKCSCSLEHADDEPRRISSQADDLYLKEEEARSEGSTVEI